MTAINIHSSTQFGILIIDSCCGIINLSQLKGTTSNDLGLGPEEIEKKSRLRQKSEKLPFLNLEQINIQVTIVKYEQEKILQHGTTVIA